MFTFWVKFIFPNRRWIEREQPDNVLKKIKDNFAYHVSLTFKNDCLKLCHSLMQKQLLQCNRIGRWWSNDNAIDIVALDDDTGTVWFGECKWSNKKAGGEIYTDLVKK